MSLRNEHFQNAARGPLKYVGPGPSAPHFENVHFEKKRIEGGDPPRNYSFWIDFVIYGVPRPLHYHYEIRFEKSVWMNQISAQTDAPRARISILCFGISKF